jgi:prolyl-tRNA editing enzyme YbaK/EbsC (Cys-tRNA(Pro) deacylase)
MLPATGAVTKAGTSRRLLGNAGSPAVSITMACADFVRLAEARVAQFAQS